MRFLAERRIEINSSTIERAIRSVALSQKNALVAGYGAGAESWANITSLI